MVERGNGMIGNQTSSYLASSSWSREQDKLFERALVMVPRDITKRWIQISRQVPGKTPLELWEHYKILKSDLMEIESGRVELPRYEDDDENEDDESGLNNCDPPSKIPFASSKKHTEPERKRGTPWTEEEHRKFLIGLEQYGKGDWRSISRNCVLSRTPTQVASHAQKYFLRKNAEKKERKRSSIHDITTPVVSKSNNTSQPPMG